MRDTDRQENTASGSKFTTFVARVDDSVSSQNENAFLVSVVMEGRGAGRNPANKLGNRLTTQVLIDQQAELAPCRGG